MKYWCSPARRQYKGQSIDNIVWVFVQYKQPLLYATLCSLTNDVIKHGFNELGYRKNSGTLKFSFPTGYTLLYFIVMDVVTYTVYYSGSWEFTITVFYYNYNEVIFRVPWISLIYCILQYICILCFDTSEQRQIFYYLQLDVT